MFIYLYSFGKINYLLTENITKQLFVEEEDWHNMAVQLSLVIVTINYKNTSLSQRHYRNVMESNFTVVSYGNQHL